MICESLLAASLLLGQTGDQPKTVTPAPSVQQTQPAPRTLVGFFNREERPVLSRIQGWFKRDQGDVQPQGKTLGPRGGVIRETEPRAQGLPG